MNGRRALPHGPVMLDVGGLSLTEAERERMLHPLVGGVILFARNYESPEQLQALTAGIRALRDPAPLIAVDHEGGRVQRFHDGFTVIPPMADLGKLWDRDPTAATAEALRLGRQIGSELRTCGVDFSFTPVLDLDYSRSAVIGDRAFHRNPRVVSILAGKLIEGLHDEGVAAVGKHFPGHGYVAADSHTEVPIDVRSFEAIEAEDLVPFASLARGAELEGIMPAHVIYPAVDDKQAGFSSIWLKDVLRGRIGFTGMIFSDALTMAGAEVAGDIVSRADAAIAAGCDMVLVCNDPQATEQLLQRWRPRADADFARRAARMAAVAYGTSA